MIPAEPKMFELSEIILHFDTSLEQQAEGQVEIKLTCAGRPLSKNFLGGGGDSEIEGSRNSCIIQSVLIPLAALPL